ncbi:chromobox protein-related [Clonorchis sinensis]|uniref:Chromobox protein-related n=1 Tax=Clonorchis sinensis TaxID=79923 RepID=H2KTL9_CLOSI|nr:chromobox protein-related [Clonorchis sinensis]
MASAGENSMRKQMSITRRRHRRRITVKNNSIINNNSFRFSSIINNKHAHQTRLNNFSKDVISDNTTTADNSDSDAVYLVEDIIGEKIVKGQKFYKVRWQGFPPDADSWEPEKNLSNVLDAIRSFHRREHCMDVKPPSSRKDCLSSVTDSPASVPTPPSTPNSLRGTGDGERLRGASEERQTGQQVLKRKHNTKSRTSGRYEYVPKHQLVASKTKYFDDIRDGKIDLSSNDLYSRVKTRRRATEPSTTATSSGDSITSTNNSGTEEAGQTGAQPTLPLLPYTLKREPTSPSSDCFNAGESLSGFQSTVDSTESERMKPNFSDPADDLPESVPDSMAQCYSVPEFESCPEDPAPQSKITRGVQCDEPSFPSGRPLVTSCTSCVQAQPNLCDVAVSPLFSARCSPVVLEPSGCCTTSFKCDEVNLPSDTVDSIRVPVDNPDNSSGEMNMDTSHVPETPEDRGPGPTVSCLRDLVQAYFGLINHFQRPQHHLSPNQAHQRTPQSDRFSRYDVTSLEELPALQSYSPLARIRTQEDLLEALDNQRWGLIATLPMHMPEGDLQCKEPAVTLEGILSPGTLINTDGDSSDRPLVNQEVIVASIAKSTGRSLVLERLLSLGLDPDMLVTVDQSAPAWSLLTLAVRLRRIHVAQALLDAGAKPDVIEPMGPRQRTALGMALAMGDVDLATMLILAGSNFYQVENGTTALSFIMKMLNTRASSTSQSTKLSVATAELQDKLRSPDNLLPSVPTPEPPPNVELPVLPKTLLLSATLGSPTPVSTSHACSSQTTYTNPLDASNVFPSVDSLRRLHDLVAAHHARLSVSVTKLVRNWLVRAGLTQVALVSPCQWINIRAGSVTISFTWPMSTHTIKPNVSKSWHQSVAPILLLVHGRVVPPACYETWMDDDGPCLVERVCLDQVTVQKPLGRTLFATTLFPLHWNANVGREHHVTIHFRQPSRSSPSSISRPTCVAVMIIAVTQGTHEPTGAANGGTRGARALTFSSVAHHNQNRSPYSNRSSINSPQFTASRR